MFLRTFVLTESAEFLRNKKIRNTLGRRIYPSTKKVPNALKVQLMTACHHI